MDKCIFYSKKGFTLVEVLAVLVIIGIVSAFAVPKYISLVDEAREKGLEGALSVGYTQVTTAYAKKMLETGNLPVIEDLSPEKPDMNNYMFQYTVVGKTDGYVIIEVENEFNDTLKGTWNIPK